jgi:hypothetical protein
LDEIRGGFRPNQNPRSIFSFSGLSRNLWGKLPIDHQIFETQKISCPVHLRRRTTWQRYAGLKPPAWVSARPYSAKLQRVNAVKDFLRKQTGLVKGIAAESLLRMSHECGGRL